MSIDTPFGSEDLMQIGRYDEPTCAECEDSGWVDWGTRMVPCPTCDPDRFNYVTDVGPVEP